MSAVEFERESVRPTSAAVDEELPVDPPHADLNLHIGDVSECDARPVPVPCAVEVGAGLDSCGEHHRPVLPP